MQLWSTQSLGVSSLHLDMQTKAHNTQRFVLMYYRSFQESNSTAPGDVLSCHLNVTP